MNISSTRKKLTKFRQKLLRALFLQGVTAIERISRDRIRALLSPSSEYVPQRADYGPLDKIKRALIATAGLLLDSLSTRKPSLIGPHPLFKNLECFSGDDVILVPGHDGRRRGNLSFCNSRGFLDHRAAHFGLRASAARREAQHAQRNYTLRFNAKLKCFERQGEPGIEQNRRTFH
jgi:hypothetical protein